MLTEIINPAERVREVIGKHMLADGFKLVLDLKNSYRSKIVDERNGDEYIDFFTFFASSPLGLNYPKLISDDVKEKLAFAAINKPSNSDIYTTPMADFVDTFERIAKPDYMKHLFFVDGGALAVANGLKVAFDWKVRKNFKKGFNEEKGLQAMHFKEAFHGRSGYTMSLTNTDINKVKYFPKFDWPRILNPKITFPVAQHLEEVINLEKQSIEEIKSAIKNNPDDIAVLIIEPIQCEGGDNFFRKEFFQQLRKITFENDIMLMFDEVQTGFGITGKFWASDYYVKPDIIAFGKKSQQCGIMVSDRVDEVEENCFTVSGRINSTWGGNLVDMVRSTQIMNIMEEEKIIDNVLARGNFLMNRLNDIKLEFPDLVSNVRGLGLLCSFDMPNTELRKKFREIAEKEKLLILGCGAKSIRFRPMLNIKDDELEEGLQVIEKVLKIMSSNK
ncbi:MAG: L-lysine 6-transaminase [Ignavibacteriaceae bacterium]|nr:L-lysine 6-transaminase [Ignavibacteriaceae bacterium]